MTESGTIEKAKREFAPPMAGHAEGAPVFERMHALVRKGYVPELGGNHKGESLVLRHIGRAPDLVLRSDGTVQGFDGRRPWYKRNIEPPAPIAPHGDAEHLRFLLFLEEVPKAGLWDRTRAWRKKYLYLPAILIVVWGICLALTAVLIDL